MSWMSQGRVAGRGHLGKKLLMSENRVKVKIILKMGC